MYEQFLHETSHLAVQSGLFLSNLPCSILLGGESCLCLAFHLPAFERVIFNDWHGMDGICKLVPCLTFGLLLSCSDASRISKVGIGGPMVLVKWGHVTKCEFDDIYQLPVS